MKLRKKIIVAIVFLLGFVQCSKDDTPKDVYFYSFENSYQGWETDATDLEIGNGQIDWHIRPSTAQKSDGSYSLEFYLDNINDSGKIWIEKGFSVTPNKNFRVNVSYKLGTSDYGDVNMFSIIAGVSPKNPEVASDLTFQGDTSNGDKHSYVWLDKKYSFTVSSTSSGQLYVFIGIWGTWEVGRTYYIDSVNVSIQEI